MITKVESKAELQEKQTPPIIAVEHNTTTNTKNNSAAFKNLPLNNPLLQSDIDRCIATILKCPSKVGVTEFACYNNTSFSIELRHWTPNPKFLDQMKSSNSGANPQVYPLSFKVVGRTLYNFCDFADKSVNTAQNEQSDGLTENSSGNSASEVDESEENEKSKENLHCERNNIANEISDDMDKVKLQSNPNTPLKRTAESSAFDQIPSKKLKSIQETANQEIHDYCTKTVEKTDIEQNKTQTVKKSDQKESENKPETSLKRPAESLVQNSKKAKIYSGNNQGNNKEESSTSKEIGSSSGTTCASVTNNQMESSESKPEQPSRRSCSIM